MKILSFRVVMKLLSFCFVFVNNDFTYNARKCVLTLRDCEFLFYNRLFIKLRGLIYHVTY